MQLFDRFLVIAQVFLTSNQDDRVALAEMEDLRDPLRNIMSAIRTSYRVFQTPKAVGSAFVVAGYVPSLARCPESQASRRRNR